MMAVEFQNIHKSFSDTSHEAIKDVSFQVEEGELITILGTSGCGKTTLLKMVNRLQEPTSGIIKIFGEDISDQDPVQLRRQIGYVIQQVGLLPHLTIGSNIAIVPKLLKWESERIYRRIDYLLELVGLDPKEYRDRYPSQLSGGQQQRVGLARALAARPKLMLLDEPFGAIDAINRVHLQNELLRIHKKYQMTFLFVTHDVVEALKLGSRILIMDQGQVRQFDTPRHILEHPADDYVASLMEAVRNPVEL